MDDSCEEDCTVYIEEIKSDIPSQRISAVEKVFRIGEVLGPRRIKEELVPYLVEVIRELDNEDEFLVKLAEQLVKLRNSCGGIQKSYYILEPLELLCCLDQPKVREKAVFCVLDFANGQSDVFYRDHFYPMVKKLATSESTPARLSATCLLHVIYPRVDDKKKEELLKLFLNLAQDEIPLVRRGVAQNMIRLSEVVPKDWTDKKLVETWRKLVVDSFDIVRMKALDAAGDLSMLLKREDTYERIFKIIRDFEMGKLSWQVRYSVCECLAAMVDRVDKEVVRKQIFDIFERCLSDNEYEVKSVALFKLSELSKRLGDDMVVSRVLPHLARLGKDTNHHVRQTVAECICPISRTVERKEKTVDTILPILEALFKDSALQVRVTAASKLGMIGGLLGPELTVKHLLPMIAETVKEKKWRFRLAVVEKLPDLYSQVGMAQFADMQTSVKAFLNDPACAVRQKAVQALNQMLGSQTLEYGKVKVMISKAIKELSKQSHYIYRVTAASSFKRLKENLKEKDLGDLFSALGNELSKDKVANVKVALLRSFIDIITKLPDSTRKESRLWIFSLINDSDEDVSFWAEQAKETK